MMATSTADPLEQKKRSPEGLPTRLLFGSSNLNGNLIVFEQMQSGLRDFPDGDKSQLSYVLQRLNPWLPACQLRLVHPVAQIPPHFEHLGLGWCAQRACQLNRDHGHRLLDATKISQRTRKHTDLIQI